MVYEEEEGGIKISRKFGVQMTQSKGWPLQQEGVRMASWSVVREVGSVLSSRERRESLLLCLGEGMCGKQENGCGVQLGYSSPPECEISSQCPQHPQRGLLSCPACVL